MRGLPGDLYHRCRTVFLSCSEFDSDAALRAVFVTDELSPFRHQLSQSANKSGRVDQCLALLMEKHLSDGRPVLPLFIATLTDRYHVDDALHNELETLAEDIQSVLATPDQPARGTSPRRVRPTQRLQSITWLHISDLHFRTSQTYDANVVLRALLRDIDDRIQQDELRPDFIAVSGDIAFSGQSSEYALAQQFFDDLLEKTGLPRNRVFVVPGNHDVDRDLVSLGAKAIGAALSDRDSVNTLLDTPGDRRLIMARFKGYAELVKSYFTDHLPFDDERYFYVHTLDIGGQQVALLGLNSAWLCGSDEDKAQGLVIGERQVRTALEQAEGASLRIALLHHPFDWLREFDQNDSAAMLLDSCDFILHGHLHRSATTQLTSPDSAAMVVACGACYKTRDFPNMYNWVQLDLTAGTGTVHLRRYSDARGGFWARDTLTYRNVPDGAYSFELRDRTTFQSMLAQPETGSASSTHPVGQPEWNTPVIRDLLTAAFSDGELVTLCFDHYRTVYEDFSSGMSKGQKIQQLMDHCSRREGFDKLVSLVRERNPAQYARYERSLKL